MLTEKEELDQVKAWGQPKLREVSMSVVNTSGPATSACCAPVSILTVCSVEENILHHQRTSLFWHLSDGEICPLGIYDGPMYHASHLSSALCGKKISGQGSQRHQH